MTPRPYTDWPTEELVDCIDLTPEREPGNDRCEWCRDWHRAVAEDKETRT